VAFRLASLEKLQTTKSVDNKSTLLDFVVTYINKTYFDKQIDENFKITDEFRYLAALKCVAGAADVDWPSVTKEKKQLAADLHDVKTLIKQKPMNPDLVPGAPKDKLRLVMTDFYRTAKAKLSALNKQYNKATDTITDLIGYFGENPSVMTFNQFFVIMKKFVFTYQGCEEAFYRAKIAEIRTKNREEQKLKVEEEKKKNKEGGQQPGNSRGSLKSRHNRVRGKDNSNKPTTS